MAPFMEYEGKSVDSAVQKACEELNISRERIQYDILILWIDRDFRTGGGEAGENPCGARRNRR